MSKLEDLNREYARILSEGSSRLDEMVLSPTMRAWMNVQATSVFTPAQNAYRIAVDSLETAATAIANDGLRHLVIWGSGYADTPDSVNASITGDLDIRVLVMPETFSPAGAGALCSKWNNATQNSWLFEIGTGKTLLFYYSTDGVNAATGGSHTSATLPAGLAATVTPVWLRVVLDVDAGGGNHSVSYYYAEWDGTTTQPGSWTQIGSAVTAAGTAAIFDSTVVVQLGAYLGNSHMLNGKIYRCLVLSGIAGTTKVDFNPNTDATDAATSFTSATGEVWTMRGTAWTAALNTALTITVNRVMDLFIRVRIQETGAKNGATTDDYQGQINLDSAGFASLAASGAAVVYRASACVTDGGATTNQLGAGSGSFVAGEVTEDGLVDDRQLTASNFAEHLFTIRIDPSLLTLGSHTLTFRTLVNGATMTYNQTPTFTIKVTSKAYAAAGGLTLSGTATRQTEKIGAVAGGLTLSGSPARSFTRVGPVAGGITFGGAATSIQTRVFIYAPAGGVLFAGAATLARTRSMVAAGGIALQGAATVSQTRSSQVSGGILFGGSSAFLHERLTDTAGGILLGGEASIQKLKTISAAGGLVFGGATDWLHERSHLAVGGLTFGGDALTSFASLHEYVAAGGILFGGAAELQRLKLMAPSGGISFGGQAATELDDASPAIELIAYFVGGQPVVSMPE